MFARNFLILAVEAGQNIRRNAAAVVINGEQEIALLFLGLQLDIAVLPVHDPVDNGVFHQGLQDQLGHKTALQPVRHVDLTGEAVLKPEGLDIDVAVHQLQLVLQRDKLAAGDSGPEDDGQVRCQGGHLGHVVGYAQPLHGIQGII